MKRRSLLGLIAGAFAPVPLVSGKPEEPKTPKLEVLDYEHKGTYRTRAQALEDLSRLRPVMTEEGRRAYDRDLAEVLPPGTIAYKYNTKCPWTSLIPKK